MLLMLNMFRILHIIPTLEGGGAERQLTMLAVEQSRRGWCVHVGIRRGGVHEKYLRNSDVVVHWLGEHRGTNPLLLVSINSLIKKIKPDVVQTWMPQMDIVGGIAALWNSVPWVVSERASRLAYLHMRLPFWFRCRVVRHASAVVANSSNGVAYWQEILPSDAHVFLVANAVDVEVIRNAASVSWAGSNDGRRTILVVGRMSPEKGVDTVIQAVRLIPVNHNIHVLIIGEGPLHKELEVAIENDGLADRISLLSYRADWWGLLKNASALVSMSRFEGCPNVVLEAMAAGCPLIVSDIPAHREFLDEMTAMLVPPDDLDALAEAIVSLLTDSLSAGERAERASVYMDGLTIKLAADSYESIYKNAITGVRQ